MKNLKILLITLLSIILNISVFSQGISINVKDMGAIGDSSTVNTEIIQKAIDSINALGGGTIYFPAGNWMTGKIFLKSNVTLDISPKATLLAAPGPIYAEPEGSITSLIYGDSLKNITITGGGVIEGKTGITRESGEGLGRRLVGLERCTNVKITNLIITHGGGATILLHSIDSLEIGNVKVLSFFDYDPEGGEGKDGVNMDGSSNVYIHNCEFRGSDDAFAFKARGSTGFQTTTENVLIERCTFASRTSNAIQFGSETNADFRNIEITDCTIEHAGKAGIGITMNDGHIIENVSYKNITMSNICTPFYIAMTNRNGIGQIHNISFENITCNDIASIPEYSDRSPHGYWVSTINGLKEMDIDSIVFKNMSLHYKGGIEQTVETISPPDPPADYQPRKLGIRPASGFYVRHAKNIEFINLTITHEKPDWRPAIVLDDTKNIVVDSADLPMSSTAGCHVYIIKSDSITVDSNLIIKNSSTNIFVASFNNGNINIYPNPGNGEFKVKMSFPERDNILIRIYSMDGRLVFDKQIINVNGNHTETINLNGFSKGVYSLQVDSGKEKFYRKIISK